VHTQLDSSIAVLKLFPGISENVVDAVLNTKGVKAVILETYGSGNAPMQKWFIQRLKNAIDNNIVILNVTQ